MKINFSPVYAISSMTGQPDPTLMLDINVEITDAPALTGTPKQIAYANSIRDGAIRDMCASAIRRAGVKPGSVEKLSEQVAPIAARLTDITSAKAWIETNGGRKSLITIQALLKQ